MASSRKEGSNFQSNCFHKHLFQLDVSAEPFLAALLPSPQSQCPAQVQQPWSVSLCNRDIHHVAVPSQKQLFLLALLVPARPGGQCQHRG